MSSDLMPSMDLIDDDSEEKQRRDTKIDEAKEAVMEIFNAEPGRVFYSVQVETRLEREYFHWITGKALLELTRTRDLAREIRTIDPTNQQVNFYRHPKYRYPKRESAQMADLLSKLYDPDFTHALGRHCEMLLDSAFARSGFSPVKSEVNEWQGVRWTKSNHNMDRILVKDGQAYGVEIKNTQNYITRDELRVKLQLCNHLDIKPVFVMRFAPKSYMHEINKAGGFGLLFEDQIYPFGYTKLMREVRERLGLKVQCPRDFKEGDMQRFANWHDRFQTQLRGT